MSTTISAEEKAIAQRLKDDFVHYANKCLKVRPKEGMLVPFELNVAQKYIHARVEEQRKATGMVRAIILKGRQEGCSTYIEGRFYWRVTHTFGTRAFILTHEDQATQNLYKMAQRYHEHCHPAVKPSIKASNARELLFDELDSGYALGTAGNKSVGRSSTVQFLHASEAAFYQHADEHAKGILQTVPFVPNTEIFIESTANGVGNWFHRQWLAAESGQSEFIAIFVPWFWQKEYSKEVDDNFTPTEEEKELQYAYHLTPEQLNWRRMKIVELAGAGANGARQFKQEYPNNSAEAFQSSDEDSIFIPAEIVQHARSSYQNEQVEAIGPLLVGVDPARFGDDRTSIIRRRGRVAFGLKSYTKIDIMEIVGIVNKIIIEENPAKVFIDIGGLGAGLYDRLKELGHGDVIVGVNFGSTSIYPTRYKNKRAEIWGLCKKWLEDVPVSIPDSNSLHADFCSVRYHIDSNSRLYLESKSEMKKRGNRSSDEADALCLTFALPVAAIQGGSKERTNTATKIMSNFAAINRAKDSLR